MTKEKIISLLVALHDDPIEINSALRTYDNFLQIFKEEDEETMDYMFGIVNMNLSQRLILRNSIAERGYELTPNELDQYIFLLLMAIYNHIGSDFK
jgi:hypothetical protein